MTHPKAGSSVDAILSDGSRQPRAQLRDRTTMTSAARLGGVTSVQVHFVFLVEVPSPGGHIEPHLEAPVVGTHAHFLGQDVVDYACESGVLDADCAVKHAPRA